jgi:alkanesulfonate monooxygenase SsuD/methylene tetrahydromethanopterin reductase-like flavin-dependent oxidoreductase (luciferase family)
MHVAQDSRPRRGGDERRVSHAVRVLCTLGQPGERYDLDFDQLKEERILVGAPEEVAERVIEYRDEFDVPFMWFRLYHPDMNPELALETIRLFGEEVIPRCRQPAESVSGVGA